MCTSCNQQVPPLPHTDCSTQNSRGKGCERCWQKDVVVARKVCLLVQTRSILWWLYSTAQTEQYHNDVLVPSALPHRASARRSRAWEKVQRACIRVFQQRVFQSHGTLLTTLLFLCSQLPFGLLLCSEDEERPIHLEEWYQSKGVESWWDQTKACITAAVADTEAANAAKSCSWDRWCFSCKPLCTRLERKLTQRATQPVCVTPSENPQFQVCCRQWFCTNSAQAGAKAGHVQLFELNLLMEEGLVKSKTNIWTTRSEVRSYRTGQAGYTANPVHRNIWAPNVGLKRIKTSEYYFTRQRHNVQ